MSLTGNAFPSKYDILATDFDETVLSDAKNAIYTESDIKTIPENYVLVKGYTTQRAYN